MNDKKIKLENEIRALAKQLFVARGTDDPTIGQYYYEKAKRFILSLPSISEMEESYKQEKLQSARALVSGLVGSSKFRKLLENGVSSNSEFVQIMGISKGRVSQFAAKGEQEGWLKKIRPYGSGKYALVSRAIEGKNGESKR